jgi:hypothetical protein
MLINYQAGRVTLHHNIWINSQWRNPNIQYTDGSTSVDPLASAGATPRDAVDQQLRNSISLMGCSTP